MCAKINGHRFKHSFFLLSRCKFGQVLSSVLSECVSQSIGRKSLICHRTAKISYCAYWRHHCLNSGGVTDYYAKYSPVWKCGNYARNCFDQSLRYFSSENFKNIGSIVTYKLKISQYFFLFFVPELMSSIDSKSYSAELQQKYTELCFHKTAYLFLSSYE